MMVELLAGCSGGTAAPGHDNGAVCNPACAAGQHCDPGTLQCVLDSSTTMLEITTASPLPNGLVGAPYQLTLEAKNGSAPYAWSVSSGSLPAGLSLSQNGTLSGTPSAEGSFSFSLQVSDAAKATASKSFALAVTQNALAPVEIATTSPLPDAHIDAPYQLALQARNGTVPYAWTKTSGSLPPGLSLSQSGALSGTPTANGSFSFTAQVTDAASTTASRSFTLTAGGCSRVGALPWPADAGPTPKIVCPTGSQSIAPGTDIAAAVKAGPAGTTFCLLAGLHRLPAVVILKSGDSVIGEYGAIVSGALVLSSWTRSGAYWVHSGDTAQSLATFGSSPWTGTHDIGPTDPLAQADDVYFDDVPLKRVMQLTDLTSQDSVYVDYGTDQIYLDRDPTGHKVEYAVAHGAFGGYGSYQTNCTVENLVIEKLATWTASSPPQSAAIFTGQGWLVEHNELRYSHLRGLTPGKNTVVRKNLIHDNGQYGIGGGGDGDLIEGNEVYRNNTLRFFNDGWDAGGTKIVLSTGVTARGNYYHDNYGPGLWFDIDDHSTTIEDNIVENNLHEGIFYEISSAAVIRHNTVRSNEKAHTGANSVSIWYGGSLLLNDSKDADIYCNLVDAGAGVNAIGMADSDRGASATHGVYEIANVHVHDNVIGLQAGAGTNGMVGRTPALTSSDNEFYDNHYYVDSLDMPHFVWGATAVTPKLWQDLYGEDTSGTFTAGTVP